jgi:hypothetical protein
LTNTSTTDWLRNLCYIVKNSNMAANIEFQRLKKYSGIFCLQFDFEVWYIGTLYKSKHIWRWICLGLRMSERWRIQFVFVQCHQCSFQCCNCKKFAIRLIAMFIWLKQFKARKKKQNKNSWVALTWIWTPDLSLPKRARKPLDNRAVMTIA